MNHHVNRSPNVMFSNIPRDGNPMYCNLQLIRKEFH